MINQFVDGDFKVGAIDGKKVLIDTATGALKGAVTGTLGVIGAGAFGVSAVSKFVASKGGDLLLRTVTNAAIDIGSDYAKAKIDNSNYGASDVVKSGMSSVFSTLAGEVIGKFTPVKKLIEKKTNLDLGDSKAENIYNALTSLSNAMREARIYRYPVEQAKDRLKEIMIAWMAKNFLNYDKGVIQKTLQSMFSVTFPEIAEKVWDFCETCIA